MEREYQGSPFFQVQILYFEATNKERILLNEVLEHGRLSTCEQVTKNYTLSRQEKMTGSLMSRAIIATKKVNDLLPGVQLFLDGR